MKSRISLLSTIGLLVPLFFVGSALAVESQPTTTTEQTTEAETLTETQKKELSERIEKRKTDAKLRLTTVQQKRIQTKCKNAQGLVKKVGGRVKGIETSRTKVHANVVDHLTKLQVKLADKGLDTTTLQAQTTELKVRIATFNTDLAAYKQLVGDLGNIGDCTADPVAFKASLEESRTALKKVHDDAVGIRTYVKDTIKPTIKVLRDQLEPKAEAN